MKHTNLSTFAKHYLVAALWSSTDDEGEPLDKSHSISDFAPEAIQRAHDDCAAFEASAEPLLALAYESDDYMTRESHPDAGSVYALAGHDFWLSRNGHGAGFFDRGNARFWRGLQNVARGMRELHIEKGDDGKLYFF